MKMKIFALLCALVLHAAIDAFILRTFDKKTVSVVFGKRGVLGFTFRLNADKNEQNMQEGHIYTLESQITIPEIFTAEMRRGSTFSIKLPFADIELIAAILLPGGALHSSDRTLNKVEAQALASPDAYVFIVPNLQDPQKPRIVLPSDPEYKEWVARAQKESKIGVTVEDRISAIERRLNRIEEDLEKRIFEAEKSIAQIVRKVGV